MDYTMGRFKVFDASNNLVGRIDHDEFVRAGIELLYRIDGEEFYDMNGNLIGFIEDGKVITPAGIAKFRIVGE